MSSLKLDPSFHRQSKPGRVGGFQPAEAKPKPAVGLASFFYLITVAAAVGASIVLSYFWAMNEF